MSSEPAPRRQAPRHDGRGALLSFLPADGHTRANTVMPQRMRHGDAGYDCALNSEHGVIIPRGKTARIFLGVRAVTPPGWFLMVQERSSLAARGCFTIGNVVDEGYRGEISAFIVNAGEADVLITPGERFVQLVPMARWTDSLEWSLPRRGIGGVGSTDNEVRT